MSLFGSYSGQEFLDANLKKREWLVEGIMRENDSVIVVGNEKSGKSLFIFQLICSLTSQHPFIDKYSVPRECRVSYVQIEGELSDSQDRMKRMVKTLDFNPSLFHLMFMPPLELEKRGYAMGLRDTIQRYWFKHSETKPDVVIFDPVYFSFMGSLSDDDIVRQFIGNLRIIKDSLNCAIILVHHTHKQRFDWSGEKLQEGDEAIFGSKFLKAWSDHTLLFIHDKKTDTRSLSCNTQRSGDIVKDCNLWLIEPDPLYFEEREDTPKKPTQDLLILNLLSLPEYKDGLTQKEFCEKLNIGSTHFYNSIKKPLIHNLVCKTNSRPVKYKKVVKEGL